VGLRFAGVELDHAIYGVVNGLRGVIRSLKVQVMSIVSWLLLMYVVMAMMVMMMWWRRD